MKRGLAVLALLASISVSSLAGFFDWEKAVSLYKQGQFREAITEFERVLAEFPEHSDSWKYVGLAFYQLKDYKSSIAPLEKALALKRKENRNDPDLYRALGQAHISLNQYDKALPYLETLARVQMSLASNYYLLGVVYANLNRPAEASDAFQKSVKLDPKDGDSWYYLGAQHFKNNRINEAIQTLKQGLLADPKNAEMLGLLTESLLKRAAEETDEKKAAATFEEAIRSATSLKTIKETPAALELLGRAYLGAKNYKAADLNLTRALETGKNPSAILYFNLGFALAQTKVWPRASEMFLQADKLNPRDLNTLYYLGFVYENLRRYPQALDAYTRAYEASGRANADLKASVDRVTPMAKQP